MRNTFTRLTGCVISVARLLLLGAVFSFLFVPTISLAQKDSVPKQPHLAVAGASHNFGAVSEGTVVEHKFVLQNTGDADLQIQRVVPACGCTASSASKSVIKPGEEAEIDAKFDTTGFSGDKTKIIRVYTNDPDQLSTVLSLKGRVEANVAVKPSRVFFGRVYQGSKDQAKPKTVVVRTRKGSDIKLGKVSSRSEYLEVVVTESTPEMKKLEVTLLPEAPISELRDRVVVEMTGSPQKSLHIPVFADIKGPVEISPAALSFGVLVGEEPVTRSLRLENKGAESLNILSLDTDHPAIQAETKTIKEGQIYVLKVTVDPTRVTKDLRSLIEVKTNNEEQEILRVSVYGILPPKI